jgi:hypothetical protein
MFKLLFNGEAAAFLSLPQRGRGTACYNIKCNITKKYRQYSRQGVKCSYHTNKLHGGKNIVLHTFYTNGTRKSTTIIERREKFSRNCGNFRKKSVNDQPRSETELQPKEKTVSSLESNRFVYPTEKEVRSPPSYTEGHRAISTHPGILGEVLVSGIDRTLLQGARISCFSCNDLQSDSIWFVFGGKG